ncbi:MAG: hypothetical protein B7X01_02390, partial [Acidiphilium sp. 21-62-4]
MPVHAACCDNREPMTPLDYLRRQPHRFSFDAAVRLLWRQAGAADPGEAIDFVSQPTLVHPVAEVEAAEPATPGKRARMTSRLIGLVGPSGMLPRWYTELVAQSVRARAPAIGDFFDMIAQRLIGHFAWAGAKYRPARAAELTHMRDPEAIDPLGGVLLALAGHGTSHMVDRLSVGPEALQHYAGFFAARPRSADRLAALASDWLGRPVELHEFIGVWLPISPDQRSKMPNGRLAGRFNQLGLDVAAGARWTIGGSFAGAGGIYLGQASTVTSNVITESGVSLATSSYFINNALIQGSHSYGARGRPPGNGAVLA